MRFNYITLNKQQFILTYPSELVFDTIKQIFAEVFNCIPAFNNPDTNYNALSKVFFVTSNFNSILSMHKQLLANGVKAPYAIFYNDTLQEQYNSQFLSNFNGIGFPTKIMELESLDLAFPTAYLQNAYPDASITNISLKNVRFVANISRANYSIEGNIFANSYPELLDIQSVLTNLVVLNRYHFRYIVSNLYIPNYVVVNANDISFTALLNMGNQNLVGKNYYYIPIVVPVYYKISSIQPSIQPFIDTEPQEYRLQCRFEFDLGIINSCNIYYNIPIKGVSVYFNLSTLSTSKVVQEITQKSITVYSKSYYPVNTYSFTVNDFVYDPILYTTSYTSRTDNQFYIYIDKYLSFSYNTELDYNNNPITTVYVNDAVYPNSQLIFSYNTQQMHIDNTSNSYVYNNDLIVPLYIPANDNEWNKILNYNGDKRLFVVINPNNGPGDNFSKDFAILINKLKQKNNVYVIGYVYSSYATRDLNAVKNDIDTWLVYYPLIDGIFIDETSTTSYSYYENLYNYIKARENRIVILNPGTAVSNSYFNIADKIFVIENTFDSLTNYTYSYTGINGYKACAIIYNIPTPSDAYYAKNYLVKDLNIKCLYLTANNPQTALFSMPTYFNIT